MVQAALITNVLEIAVDQHKYPFKPISTETTRSQQHLKKIKYKLKYLPSLSAVCVEEHK